MVTVTPHDGSRTAPVDAMCFWLSSKLRNDQFQVYAFDGRVDVQVATAELLSRARTCPELCVRANEGLTHGVHGIGDTVVISVHAAESAIPDADAYVGRLASALRKLAPSCEAVEVPHPSAVG